MIASSFTKFIVLWFIVTSEYTMAYHQRHVIYVSDIIIRFIVVCNLKWTLLRINLAQQNVFLNTFLMHDILKYVFTGLASRKSMVLVPNAIYTGLREQFWWQKIQFV